MPTDSHAEQTLASVCQAKDAYIQALRQAFLDGLDPVALVQRGVLNRAFQDPHRRAPSVDIDLTTAAFEPDPTATVPLLHYVG